MNGEEQSQTVASRVPSAGRGSGFTLIELMVVIVLIAIMTAVILPEMKGTFEEALLRSTGRELVTACHLAYSQAVSGNQLCRLHLDLQKGRYQLERAAKEGEGGGHFAPLRNVPGAEGELDKRIQIEIQPPEEESSSPESSSQRERAEPRSEPDETDDQDASVISFFPDGTAARREIRLRDRDGFRLVLRINPTTARVKVVDLGRQ